MMKKNIFPPDRAGVLIVVLSLIAVAASCTARIDGTLRSGGSAELKLRAALGARTSALIRSLQSLMGGAPGDRILDGPALARSLSAAPGIASVFLENTGPAAIEGTITVARIGDLLSPAAPGPGMERFVTWEESGGGGRLRLNLDRNSAPAVIALISPEVTAYMEALMAPAVTGEQLSRGEYLDLVAAVYGRPLADEIAAARIQLFLEFPRPVAGIRGGTASGNRAEFSLPLAELLVLESPLVYEVSWQDRPAPPL
jgi:hypothetical protein